jgi:VWFA-related protein
MVVPYRTRLLNLARCSVLACTPLLHAQGTQTPVITANARLVVLDTVVTDAHGKPVGTLTEKDFQVFEDGQQQRIRSVEPPSLHTLPAASAAANTVFDPAQPASFGQSPVNILVLDQLNTHFADSSFARRAVHDFLARQPALLAQPTSLLSVYDEHFKQLQGFTRDREALLRALAAAPTEYAWKLETNGKTEHGPLERLDQSLRALTEMAQSYARIPGRKNLIWVGGGFPSQDPDALAAPDLKEIKDTIHHITNVLLDTRITLYAVDPSSTAPGMTEITDATQMAFVSAVGDAGAAGAIDPFSTTEDFDRLGPVTGGRVIRARNDVAAQIAESVDLGANFYTISYTPSSASETSARFRHIQVVCLRPGLTAVARDGYYTGATSPKQLLADASYDLTTAAESAVPLNALHVAVTPATGAYVVKVSVPDLTWKPNGEAGSSASVYVLAVLLNTKSKPLGHSLLGMTANARPDANLRDPAKTADFQFPFEPSPKAATLRFVVRDSATGRMGSFDLPLTPR